MALISVNNLADLITSRRRATVAGNHQTSEPATFESARIRRQLMAASSLASIVEPFAASLSRHPSHYSQRLCESTVNATIAGLTLNRETGTVTGSLITDGAAVWYRPQFLSTPKGRATVRSDGTFTYTPCANARRAAARTGASFRGSDTDSLSLTASSADGSPMRVRACIAILGH